MPCLSFAFTSAPAAMSACTRSTLPSSAPPTSAALFFSASASASGLRRAKQALHTMRFGLTPAPAGAGTALRVRLPHAAHFVPISDQLIDLASRARCPGEHIESYQRFTYTYDDYHRRRRPKARPGRCRLIHNDINRCARRAA